MKERIFSKYQQTPTLVEGAKECDATRVSLHLTVVSASTPGSMQEEHKHPAPSSVKAPRFKPRQQRQTATAVKEEPLPVRMPPHVDTLL